MSQDRKVLDWELPASNVRGKPFYGKGAPVWWFAHLIRVTLGWLSILVFRSRFLCTDRIPEGAVIFAANHSSSLDPAMLYGRAPKKMIHFIGKKEIWRNPFIGWCADRLGALPVYRGAPDRWMLKTATELLKAGEHIAIFPEGTRVRSAEAEEQRSGHGGAAFLSMLTGAPVVPVGIAGSERIDPGDGKPFGLPRVVYRFGQPIYPGDFAGTNKERTAAMTDAIMAGIVAQRRAAQPVSDGTMSVREARNECA